MFFQSDLDFRLNSLGIRPVARERRVLGQRRFATVEKGGGIRKPRFPEAPAHRFVGLLRQSPQVGEAVVHVSRDAPDSSKVTAGVGFLFPHIVETHNRASSDSLSFMRRSHEDVLGTIGIAKHQVRRI